MTNLAENIEKPNISEPEITPELGAEHGLNQEEYDHMLQIVGRTPTFTELGIFSVMWSEHCSYKSSRLHLKKLPTKAPWVIQGPGENAGVIDIGDGQAAIFKMESHNHPSFIEPYQGAATGVGGIMRDIFTMGARPIANINALRFGDPSHPKTRHLVSGVVAGISGYGNCMGVPTVGGETNFHSSYNGNILVNAMTLGIADQDKIYYARGAGVGQPIVYVGSKTGRDGIHGATMSSAEFGEGNEENRPTVQVGDPFTEKLLLEACLELMQSDAIISIQDMGAAGLTSSSVEIADKGGIGVRLDLDKVPQRETMMTPYEIMLSESQERMLMILKPGQEDMARAIFEKWDLDFAVIGETTDTKHLEIHMYGEKWCDIPVPPLVDEAPIYDRPQGDYPEPESVPQTAKSLPEGVSLSGALEKMIGSPNQASKKWIWEQYDSLVMGETIFSPGIRDTQSTRAGDAAIVKMPDSDKSLAISSDCTPRYCYASPFEGGKQAVAESYRNISATGATPKAVTNNLNFGNPERPKIMHQFVRCIEGMAEACEHLDYPVISGNVSLYNETNGNAINPTPVIGGVGILDDYKKAVPLNFEDEGLDVYLVGQHGEHLGQSIFIKDIHNLEKGAAPSVDLALEKKNGTFIQKAAAGKTLKACHDISDGGLLLTLAEMGLLNHIGIKITLDQKEDLINDMGFWFGEDQARYVIATDNSDQFEQLAAQHDIEIHKLGKTIKETLEISSETSIDLKKLAKIHESWLPNYMEGRDE